MVIRFGWTRFYIPHGAKLVGRRICLQPPRYSDWRAWADARGRSRNFLVPWEPAWAPDALSRAAYRRRLRHIALEWRDDVGYSFLIFRQEDETLLGGVTLSNIRRGVAQAASLGYWIGQPFARQGYMAEALQCLLPFAFDRLALHRVEAACLPHNAASRGLLTKIGFREEGHARLYLKINGAWQDHVLYALVRDDPWWKG